jgi:hypothetical protein
MANYYGVEVAKLREALESDNARAEAGSPSQTH